MQPVFNKNLEGLGVSPTLRINEKVRELTAQGKSVYNLGLGQSPFPVPDPVVEALKLYAPQKDYLPVKGLRILRETVANFHLRKDGVDIDPECVIIGPGSKELLFLLQLVFEGDVYISSPCWVSYIPQAKILGKSVKVIPTSYESNWLLTPELLRNALRGKDRNSQPSLLIMNYPGNPEGQTYSENLLEELAQVAMDHNVIILSDEIYGQLNHRGDHISIARFYPSGTIISSGLSKWCGAGGWRLGTFSFPKKLKSILELMAIVASETYTSVSAPIQYAAVFAFRGGSEIENYLWHTRRILSGLGNQCVDIMQSAGIRVHKPAGAFYLFPDCSPLKEKLSGRGIKNSHDLAYRLLEEAGVALLPGSDFNRPPDELTLRMAYVDFDGAKALSASHIIPLHEQLPEEFFKQHCSRVIKGVKVLSDWIS